MKYVVAVSGGVDSMVLLDMLVKAHGATSLIVAHFDHGIRKESHRDALFVEEQAHQYGCRFEALREGLGATVSEETARTRRYLFLKDVARRFDTRLVTAHHLDDLVETVVLHLQRGTGWRGLTPFGQDIERPLLSLTKDEIIKYAQDNKLSWREDETNKSDMYARNRVRPAVQVLPLDTKLQIAALYARQWEIRSEIESQLSVDKAIEHSRYEHIMLPPGVRREYIRFITKAQLTRPQMDRLALAICTARPGSVFEAGSGLKVHFTTRTFTL